MKIYLATTAPGTEAGQPGGSLAIPRRLLSYHHIVYNILGVMDVFVSIINNKVKGEQHA